MHLAESQQEGALSVGADSPQGHPDAENIRA
jgi:hypothetical protein